MKERINVDKVKYQIDFVQLFKYLWSKKILIAAISFVVALILSLIPYIKALNNYKVVSENWVESTEDVDEATTGNIMIDLKDDYMESAQEGIEYFYNSVYFNLNPYCIDTVNLQYKYTGDGNVDLLENYVLYGGLVEDVYSMDDSIELRYLQELIGANNREMYNALNGNGPINNVRDALQKEDAFGIRIYGKDEQQVNHLADLVEKAISDNGEKFGIAKDELVLLNRSYMQSKDTFVISQQNDVRSKMEGYATKIVNVPNVIQTIVQTASDTNTVVPEKPSYSVKVLVVDFVGVVIVLLFVYAVIYLFSGKIKYAGEIREYYNLALVGETPTEISAKLTAMAKKNGYKNCVVIAKNVNSEQLAEINKCKGDLSVTVKEDLMESFDAISDADAVVIAEQVWSTKYDDVKEMIRMCMDLDANLIGYVSFKK